MMNDFLINVFLVAGCVFATAQLVNFICEASEESRKSQKESLKKLHARALAGDHKSSEDWEEMLREM